MRLRTLLLSSLGAMLLSGCVVSAPQGPLSTEEGRRAAVNAYVALGVGYLQKGQSAQAKIPLQKALSLDNHDADANAALALVFQSEQENTLAEQYFKRALAEKNSARIQNNYGSFLYAQGRYAEAQAHFEQAAADALYSGRAGAYTNVGLTALKLNDPTLAQASFSKAIALDPQQAETLLKAAEVAFNAGQFEAARGYYLQLNALKGVSDARSLLLGYRLARHFHEPNLAADSAARLQRLYPSSPEYRQYLSEQQ